MPRNVRNFWLEFDIDGRGSVMASGPVSKDGGFSGRILMRHDGGIVRAVELDGRITSDGRIVLEIGVCREVCQNASIDVNTNDDAIVVKTIR